MDDYPKFGLRDRTTMRPSRRPFVKEAECTPPNARREDILREVYHIKLLSILGCPKGVYAVMGRDGSAWCAP